MRNTLILVLDYTEKESDEDCLDSCAQKRIPPSATGERRSARAVAALPTILVMSWLVFAAPRLARAEFEESFSEAYVPEPLLHGLGDAPSSTISGAGAEIWEPPVIPLTDIGELDGSTEPRSWDELSPSAPGASGSSSSSGLGLDWLSDDLPSTPVEAPPAEWDSWLGSSDPEAILLKPQSSWGEGAPEPIALAPSSAATGTGHASSSFSSGPPTGNLASASHRLLDRLRNELDLSEGGPAATPAPPAKPPVVAMSAANWQTHLLVDWDEENYTPHKALKKKRRRKGAKRQHEALQKIIQESLFK